MTQTDRPAFWKETDGPRLPRIALMGEFSAGKSTLANMMIGTSPLPVQVVATQLPPVWISHGDKPSVIVDLEGRETPCDLETLTDIVPEDIAFIRFFCEEEILSKCEIIDMPGISDPNMASEVWERIMPFADGVLWCSPATQAWRRSEAAVWEDMDDRIQKNSLLVLTRGDMLLTEADKAKVMRRVRGEAGEIFADILMISLAQARDAGDDEELWAESGADRFVARFLDLVDHLAAELSGLGPDGNDVPEAAVATDAAPRSCIVPRRPVARGKTREQPPEAPDPMSFLPKFS